jgi:hypothetical protein
MSKSKLDPLEYYASHGLITDPKEYSFMLNGLPNEISRLCQIVQGTLIHIFWAERQGAKLPENRKNEVNIRRISQKLALIRKMNNRPLNTARPLEKRLVGNCRDFTIMLYTMLQHQKVPVRARCGFATDFDPGRYEDHWVCEHWNSSQQRWVMVDAQLDVFQRKALQIKFDPCSMPGGRFLPAGEAWQLCREGKADPELFGIFDMREMDFIKGNLLRDLAALNKMGLLPWDCWGLILKSTTTLSKTEQALLDHAATLALADNSDFQEMRATYENNSSLRVSRFIRSFSPTAGAQTIDIFEDKPNQ